MKTEIKLKNHSVELFRPALVKKSRWFCWFPSLIMMPDGILWAVMQANADIHVSDSCCYLSRSRDKGLTWEEPFVIGDAGLNHLILPDGSAMIIPYYLRPRPDGAIGAPCNILSPTGELSMLPSGVNVRGFPNIPKPFSPDLSTAGFVFNGQVIIGNNNEYLTTLYGTFAGDKRYSLLLAESENGFDWRIRSIIAGPECNLDGEEGPCESAICRLPDGRIMCIFRLASFVPYGQTFSSDDGNNWSVPNTITPSSVEPSLQIMNNGVIALSGGRPGISLWINSDGSGKEWENIDIIAAHNNFVPDDCINPNSKMGWISRDDMIKQGLGGFTSCYTEIVKLDNENLLLIYDRIGLGWNQIPDESNETNSVWAMRIKIKKAIAQ
jgi:hypothetical protein